MDNKRLIDRYFETSIQEDKTIKLLFEGDDYSIGKQGDKICFIVKSDGGPNRRFMNGDMSISINARYIVSDIEGLYSIIFYHTDQPKRLEIFIDTLVSYATMNKIKSDDLLTLYNEISEVFKKIDFDYNKFVGNIGELLFIKHMYNIHKINMVDYYKGSDPHLVDFMFNDVNFEIKTSLSDERKHHINNDQLIGNGYLCSILIKEQNNGMTIDEIFNGIKDLFMNFQSKKAYFQNFLLSVPFNYSNQKFNTSIDNIRLYAFTDIPKFNNYHESISNIRFICDFSNMTFLSIDKLFA